MFEKKNLTLIIPAYNEAENLTLILSELIGHCKSRKWKIIIINDGSKDSTKEVLNSYSFEDELTVINHKLNKGYGAAIKTGIAACLTEFCITIDADGQHRLDDIAKLYHLLIANDADMIVGSRKGIKSATFARGIGKSIIRTLAKILMPIPIYDINSGMKIYRTDLAQKYIHLAPDTMAYSDIITLLFINNRHLVLEEPIRINERLRGTSTINIQTAFQTVMEIINIVILFNPMKIFLPISLLFFIIGIIIGLPILLHGNGLSFGSVLGIFGGIIFFLLGLVAEQLSLIRRHTSQNIK
jgi:glycosyltransferase involved in cell wall biosynthesis